MPRNTFAAFFFAGSMGFIGGMLSLLIASILFSGAADNEDFSFCVLFGVFMDVVMPFFFCVLFLLPLAAIEKTKMEERSFITLIKRYTPFIALPFGLLSAFILLSTYQHPSEKYSFLVITLDAFGICAFALWFFVKQIKSS